MSGVEQVQARGLLFIAFQSSLHTHIATARKYTRVLESVVMPLGGVMQGGLGPSLPSLLQKPPPCTLPCSQNSRCPKCDKGAPANASIVLNPELRQVATKLTQPPGQVQSLPCNTIT